MSLHFEMHLRRSTSQQLEDSGLNAPRAFHNDESFRLLVEKIDQHYSPAREECIKLLHEVAIFRDF